MKNEENKKIFLVFFCYITTKWPFFQVYHYMQIGYIIRKPLRIIVMNSDEELGNKYVA